MSNSTNPAFPHFNQHGEVIHDSAVGITKREYFAAAAMTGLAANGDLMNRLSENLKLSKPGTTRTFSIPELALAMAEDILALLEKK